METWHLSLGTYIYIYIVCVCVSLQEQPAEENTWPKRPENESSYITRHTIVRTLLSDITNMI
jgi:hypothetical protein